MLKKCLIVMCLMCLSLCFGAQIPKEKQAAYKAEIEKYAIVEYPKLKKNIDKDFEQAKTLYNKLNLSKTIEEQSVYSDKLETQASSIDSDIFWYYMGLLDITEKYVKIKDNIPPSDYMGVIYDALKPFFASANVDTDKVDRIFVYGRDKAIIIEKWAGFVD